MIHTATVVVFLQWLLITLPPSENLVFYPINNQSHIFEDSVYVFADSTLRLKAQDVLSSQFQHNFKVADTNSFKVQNTKLAYWMRYELHNASEEPLIVITKPKYIHKIDLYIVDTSGKILHQSSGLAYPSHKWSLSGIGDNVFFHPFKNKKSIVFCRVEADLPTGMGNENYNYLDYIKLVRDKFFYHGAFYGVSLFMFLLSLVLWVVSKEKIYLFYSLYVLSLSIFSVVTHGFLSDLIGGHFRFSFDYYTFPYALITIFLILYSREFLQTKLYYPLVHKILAYCILIRVILLVMPYLFGNMIHWRSPIVDNLLLMPAFFLGIWAVFKGNRYAMSFLMSLSIIFLAQYIQIMELDRKHRLTGFLFQYISLTEIFMFFVALGFRYSQLKTEKEAALLKLIEATELQNKELEEKVRQRTQTIEELYERLKIDNVKLEENFKSATKAHATHKLVSYEDFLKIYPDEESCYQTINEIKWEHGFECRKCGNHKYSMGHVPFSRKCTKCDTVETVLANTVFSGLKFPINKAFYILMVASSGKDVPATELARILDMRMQTCWTFKNKVTERMESMKNKIKGEEAWKKLIKNN